MTARGPRGSSLVISVLVTVLAVAGTMVLVIRLPGRATEMTSASGASRGPAPAMAAARLARGVTAAPSRRGAPSSKAPSSKAPATTAAPTASAPATATPGGTAPGSTAPGGTAPVAGESTATEQVLALINQARAQAGLPAYTISSGLDTSAARHTAVMAGGCGLSHQCPGEPDLGARETAAGVAWTTAGENIGEGGPVADTPAAIAQMAVGLTQSMLAEKPPDDGHRLNILSSAFTHAGISVFRDSSGTVWMTQDFSN